MYRERLEEALSFLGCAGHGVTCSELNVVCCFMSMGNGQMKWLIRAIVFFIIEPIRLL